MQHQSGHESSAAEPGDDRRSRTALAGWLLPFALVVYLGLRGGGWDTVVHGQVGVVVWIGILVAALVGALPLARLTKEARIALALLAALTLWSALAIAWSESGGRTVDELVRVATYLGILVLALVAHTRGDSRRTLSAVAAAIGALGVLALLSRLHPAWFPVNELALAQPGMRERLNYPLNYWNGVAVLLAMGIPLLLAAAVEAKQRAIRALAAATLPALALAIFFTYSRASVLLVGLGIVVLAAAASRRARVIAVAGVAAIASGALIVAASSRKALADGLGDEVARRQGDEMIAITVAVCAVVAAVSVATERFRPRWRPRAPALPKRGVVGGLALAATALLALALALGAPGAIEERWQQFKQPAVPGDRTERFQTTSGGGRYQYWAASLDAAAEKPLTGTGPGTFQLWWTRQATIPGPVRDAHSLYVESIGELGIPGFLLVIAFVGTVAIAGVRRVRSRSRPTPALVAAALASAVVFLLAAGIDWFWEIPAISVAFLLLAAALLQPASEGADRRLTGRTRGLAALAALPVIALLASAVAGTLFVRESQADARASDLSGALDAARAATALQPYSASARIQEALVLERLGELGAAAAAAIDAMRMEPTNWQMWAALAQIEASRERVVAATRARERAASLNPQSWRFQQPE